MKSQEFLAGMLIDLGTPVGLYSVRDVETVNRRIACEGEQFLSITLPQLDDALLQGLSTGALPTLVGWSTKRGTALPEFLYGHWKSVFNPDGTLRAAPSIHSIRAIRQVSRAFKKVFEVCDDRYVDKALASFVKTDASLSEVRFPKFMDTLAEIAHYLYGEIVGTAVASEHMFRHGPGAVAEGYDSVARWDFSVISAQAEELVGAETFRPTWEYLKKEYPQVHTVEARVLAVPKTAVKPRLITVEPSYNQFLQQGLAAELKRLMSRFPVISITDQSRNKELARVGSLDGSLATIDLSDASDRLHNGLVRRVFSWNPSFVDWIQMTRSQAVLLPSGELVQLNKFAGMGSSLTFPVQTMVFAAIVCYALCAREGKFSRSTVRKFLTREDVGIYGDDIIVPAEVGPTVVSLLHELGLKVNTNKSFFEGGFRESCGGDYYRGFDVTPVYVRRRMPETQRDVTELVSLSSFRAQWVHKYGYGTCSQMVDDHISSIIPYPAGSHTVTRREWKEGNQQRHGICRVGPADLAEGRWNEHLFRREVRMMIPVPLRKRARGSTRGVLFKTLYGGYNRDIYHLTHHGRAMSAKLKHGWVAIT